MSLSAQTLGPPQPERLVCDLGGQLFEQIDSETSRWLIDWSRRRFVCLPLDVDPALVLLEMPWSPYDHAHEDRGALVLWLDQTGSRRIRITREGAAGTTAQPLPGT